MVMDFLYFIDPETMILGLLFVIILAFTNFALGKTLGNKSTSGVIAFCVALITVYGINKLNWDILSFSYRIGLTEKLLYTLVPLIILALIAYFIIRKGLRNVLIFIGILFIILSFTDWIYEKTILLIIGIVLLVLGIVLRFRKKKILKKKGILKIQNVGNNKRSRRGNNQNSSNNASQNPPQNNPAEERRYREQRLRSQRELQKKYNFYSDKIKKLVAKKEDAEGNVIKPEGKIPPRGTTDGDSYHRYRQAMETCLEMARRQGFRLR